MSQTITLIRGDGIGPEICESVVQVFQAAKIPVSWEEAVAGLGAITSHGSALPQQTLDSIRRNGIALKGPTTTPVGGGHRSVNVLIRKSLELYANVRLAKSMPAVQTRFDNVDILIVRENIEDTYAGIEHMQTPNVAQGLKIITRQGSKAIVTYAFEEARKLGRKRVTCVHKANIHKLTDGLFLEVFRQVAAEYTDIEANDVIVDNCCMQLVSHPEQYDVMVLPNLYGDIVSDLCAGIVGGLGVAPGGNIGRDCAVFEAVHGSAPDIAGRGMANPTALLLSATQMLQYMGLVNHAQMIQLALFATLGSGVKTRDLGGTASTEEFTHGIIARLSPVPEETSGTKVDGRVTHPVAQTVEEDWDLVGVDVFVEHAGGLPPVPKSLGSLTLQSISNRGTRVWPGDPKAVMLVDHHWCRYLFAESVVKSDVTALLNELDFMNLRWMHVELLSAVNGQPRYATAAGE